MNRTQNGLSLEGIFWLNLVHTLDSSNAVAILGNIDGQPCQQVWVKDKKVFTYIFILIIPWLQFLFTASKNCGIMLRWRMHQVGPEYTPLARFHLYSGSNCRLQNPVFEIFEVV